MARRLKWARTTLRRRLADPTCPVPPGGPWPAKAISELSEWAAVRYKRSGNRCHVAEPDLMLAASGTSPALERYRAARARLAELELAERQQTLLRRDLVHDRMTRLAAVLRGAGEALARHHGPEAHAVLEEALNDYERELDNWLGNGARSAESPSS